MAELEKRCVDAGLKMTDQRRAILKVLEESKDHPAVETVFDRARAIDSSVSIATVYRTLSVLDELGLVLKHDFGGDFARFEVCHGDGAHHHHHHLIDIDTGHVLEFQNDELEKLIHRIGEEMGYEIEGHNFDLFGRPKKNKKK